jgi:predicted outer membrane repeat protein
MLMASSRSTQNISIDGNEQAVIDANCEDQIFVVHTGSSLSIARVTMQNGCVEGSGGAVAVLGFANFTSCRFLHNTANPGSHGAGGAVALVGGAATITSCTFERNTAPSGFGGAIFSALNEYTLVLKGYTLELKGCTFKNNSATGDGWGGGAVAVSEGSATITSCTFEANTASDSYEGGGAICVQGVESGGWSTTITSCVFKGGTGSHVDSVSYQGSVPSYGTVTFVCPSMSVGTPVALGKGAQLNATQLPPAKEVVHCTPSPPPSALYKCINSKCVLQAGGLPKATCEQLCG